MIGHHVKRALADPNYLKREAIRQRRYRERKRRAKQGAHVVHRSIYVAPVGSLALSLLGAVHRR